MLFLLVIYICVCVILLVKMLVKCYSLPSSLCDKNWKREMWPGCGTVVLCLRNAATFNIFVVTSNLKLSSLLLHTCNFSTVMNRNVYSHVFWWPQATSSERVANPQVENPCCSLTGKTLLSDWCWEVNYQCLLLVNYFNISENVFRNSWCGPYCIHSL